MSKYMIFSKFNYEGLSSKQRIDEFLKSANETKIDTSCNWPHVKNECEHEILKEERRVLVVDIEEYLQKIDNIKILFRCM